MILSENYIKIPGRQYKVKVQCVSTRRLTAMEWLIVNCAYKFHDSEQTGNLTLKYVFEEIFQLTSSEILIKPCIESLIAEQAITLDVGPNFEYNSLTFSKISLTEKGKRMAQDGLFPGATRELPLDIYYNPLTEKMNQFVGGNEQIDDAIEFGAPSDYSVDFPEEKIIDALHKGLVGRGKFVASKLRIESIDCVTSTDWDDFVKIEVETTDGNSIFTKPQIREDRVKSLVPKLLQPKEITNERIRELIWLEETQPKKILGAGAKIKESFLEVAKNGSIIGFQNGIFSLYKRNTSAYKGKIVFLWDESKFEIRKENETLFVHMPFTFEIPGCVVINEKNESLSLAKKKYFYEEQEVFAPIAFEDKRINIGGNNLSRWIETIVEENYFNDVRYLSMYTLQSLEMNRLSLIRDLESLWIDADIDTMIDDMSVIAQECSGLGTEMICLDDFGDMLWEKLSALTIEEIVERLGRIMSLRCIHSGSEAQKVILDHVISLAEPPKTYNELMPLLHAIGINSYEDAIRYDGLVSKLYTHELLVDAIQIIMDRKFSRLPELFTPDVLFNQYESSISGLEFLIAGLNLFGKGNADQIESAIEKCSDIALIQSYVSTIDLKNTELLSYGVNVYAELATKNAEKADNFFTNLEVIKHKIETILRADTEENINETKNGVLGNKNRTVYIVDTCALIHEPELLLYFKDDDYVRIPTKVIDELGKIKDMRSVKYSPEVSRTAAKIVSDIETKYLKLFNQTNKLRLMIENADLSLLPPDLDKSVPDNQILSVALKYKDWNVVVISDDGVFRLASLSQDIKTTNSKEFVQENEIYRRSLERWVEKFKKDGGSFSIQSWDKKNTEKKIVQTNSIQADIAPSEVDELPVKELKKYIPKEINDQVLAFISNNGIKTIGQFRLLSQRDIEGLKAKGRQVIFKNIVGRAVKLLNSKLALETNESESEESKDKEEMDNPQEDGIGNINEVITSSAVVSQDEQEGNADNIQKIEESNELNSEEVEFKNAIISENLEDAMFYYLSLSNRISKYEQTVLFRSIMSTSEIDEYSFLMRFILNELPKWQVKQVLGYIDIEIKDKVLQNTNWEKIVTSLVGDKKFGELAILINELDLDIDYEGWFAEMSKEDLMLQIQSTYAIEKYIGESLEGEEEKVLDGLEKDYNIPWKLVAQVCLENIAANVDSSVLYENVLCSYFARKRSEGNSISLSVKNIVDLAIALPETKNDNLKRIVEQCTTSVYKMEANKHYAQAVLTPKTMEPLKRMLDAGKSVSRIVYVYMNTKLRGEINVDRIISELVAKGYDENEVMKELRDYWILGKIKYIQDDGLVRVAAESISNSRLMVFRTGRMSINGREGFVDPEEGMQVYFKLQDYKEGGQFYIHYLCTDIDYLN